MKTRTTRFLRHLSGMLALLFGLSTATTAMSQSWDSLQPAFGKGAAVCNGRDDEGNTFCFGLRCSAADNAPEWFTVQIGGGSDRGNVTTAIIIDGKHHFQIPMTERQWQNQWDFAGAYDATDHAALVNALKAGSRVSVQVGRETQADLSLRGSSREITRVLAMCNAASAGASAASDGAINEPFDAVLAMAAKQDCEATESEIFTAITEAGFDAWSANLFVTGGTKDGTLQLIDRTDFKYRVTGCKVEKNALAVDPGATELTVTAAQLPQPVRTTITDIAAMCGNAFQTEGRSKKALQADDIDGDGTYDFLLDHAQFCPDAITTMCGASHCPMTLFVSDKGAWRRFDFFLQGYKEFTAQGFLFECSTPNRKAGVFMENGTLVERNCQ